MSIDWYYIIVNNDVKASIIIQRKQSCTLSRIPSVNRRNVIGWFGFIPRLVQVSLDVLVLYSYYKGDL